MTAAGRSTIPMKLAGANAPLVLVPAHVNGEGPFDFILDTGAATSLLAEDVAARLGVAIEETKEAVGDTCAVAVRFAVDELLGEDGITHQGEGHDVVAMLAELPDLWDVNVSGWPNDSIPSRFGREGHQEKYISFVKGLTTKPVVGVGRYTSPESMVSAIQRGVIDLIGAARPSIADPFLPTKIKEGRVEDIRECIGCNICITGDTRYVPIRCTQNPTMGEEWKRGWHPEIITKGKSEKEVMVVGAGPAGLEAASVTSWNLRGADGTSARFDELPDGA